MVLAGFSRRVPDYLAVNGPAHSARQLHIQLGKHIDVKDTGFGDAPNGRGLYYVLNDKLLIGLVLGHALGTGGAMNRLHLASAFFGMTAIPSFLGHLGNEDPRELEDVYDCFQHWILESFQPKLMLNGLFVIFCVPSCGYSFGKKIKYLLIEQ